MSSTYRALIPLAERSWNVQPHPVQLKQPEMHPRGATNVPQPLTSTQPAGPDSKEPQKCLDWDFGASAPSLDLLLRVQSIG